MSDLADFALLRGLLGGPSVQRFVALKTLPPFSRAIFLHGERRQFLKTMKNNASTRSKGEVPRSRRINT